MFMILHSRTSTGAKHQPHSQVFPYTRPLSRPENRLTLAAIVCTCPAHLK